MSNMNDEIQRRRSKHRPVKQEQEWLKNNHDAIHAHNKRIDKKGPLLTPPWMRD